MLRYTTKQSSGDSTIDMYWQMVNNRYQDIHNKHSFAFDKEWANGAISDAKCGIDICDIVLTYRGSILISRYRESFLLVIQELELLKHSMTK